MTLFRITGNPFVDAGIFALCHLSDKQEPEQLDVNNLRIWTDKLPDYYSSWSKLGNMFTQNAKILNPATKRAGRNKKAYRDFLNGLLSKVSPTASSGTCLSCGARDAETSVYREVYPLTGSGDMLNYFSFFEPGLPLCAVCVLAVQFAPFYLIARNGRLALVHSPNPKLMRQVAKRAVYHALAQASASQPGFYRPDFARGGVSDEVFAVRLARQLIAEADSVFGPTAMRVYLFANSGERNVLSYLDLPAPAFAFLENAKLAGLQQELQELLQRNEQEICRCLLEGESILSFFLDRQNRHVVGGWTLLELYLKEVEGLDPERLEVLKKVGQRLFEYLKATSFRRLQDLEQALDGRYGDVLVTLTRIQREALICDVDDVGALFPRDTEGRPLWREALTLLLLYIYARMWEANIKPTEV
jgi:CRISPR-associated protein Cst1